MFTNQKSINGEAKPPQKRIDKENQRLIENAKQKRELAQLREEVTILKKASAYFASNSKFSNNETISAVSVLHLNSLHSDVLRSSLRE